MECEIAWDKKKKNSYSHGIFCCFGRHVPRNVKGLKMVNCNNTMLGDDASATTDVDEARIVVFRYSEYCVTAPLLFLSVVSLLTVDAPAWLYISGYGLIVACNLWGIVLHYSITWPTKGTSEDTQSFVLWLNSLLLTGSW